MPDRTRTIERQLIRDVLSGKATMDTLDLGYGKDKHCRSWTPRIAPSAMRRRIWSIRDLSATAMTMWSISGTDAVPVLYNQPVPRVAICPAHGHPGYVALVEEGRYADAIRLIRAGDNLFLTTCGFICEHPREATCRRNMVIDAVNIRGLKRFAADYVKALCDPPECTRQRERRSLFL
ncbi:MAG: hypothetical protein ACLU48_05800 [Clostridiaceae bacterium]